MPERLALLGALTAFGVAALLQAWGARTVVGAPGCPGAPGGPVSPGGPGQSGLVGNARLVLRLARNLPFLAGAALDVVGVLLTAVALRSLPLFLVQAAVAASLCVTAIGSVLLFPAERQVQRWGAVLAVTAGLAVLGSAAQEGPASPLTATVTAVLGAGVPLLLVLAAVLDRFAPRHTGLGLAALTGFAYAGLGVSLRGLDVPRHLLLLAVEPAALAAAAYLAVGLLLFARALQLAPVTQVMAVVVTLDTLVPAAVGVALLGDRTRPGWGAAAGLGLLLTVLGVLRLSSASTDIAGAPAGPAQPTSGRRARLRPPVRTAPAQHHPR